MVELEASLAQAEAEVGAVAKAYQNCSAPLLKVIIVYISDASKWSIYNMGIYIYVSFSLTYFRPGSISFTSLYDLDYLNNDFSLGV